MKVKIHREGLNILLALLVVLLAINVPLYLCLENRVVPIVTISISTIFYLLVVNFFRSPRRHFKGDPENAVVASVDGKVVALEEVYEDEYLHRNVIQLSIFMTVFNVLMVNYAFMQKRLMKTMIIFLPRLLNMLFQKKIIFIMMELNIQISY